MMTKEPSNWSQWYASRGRHSIVNLIPLKQQSTPGHKPFVTNYEVAGQPGYATKDLVLPHPTKAGLWKL